MTQRLVTGVLVGAIATVFAGGVAAQAQPKVTTGYVPGTAPASDGYVQSGTALTPTDGTVKSGVYNGDKGLAGNLCYRTGYWTPSMATKECDPDLVPKPPAPGVQKITLASKALFDFDKAVLKPEGKAAIDTEIIAKLKDVQKLELVLVTGHTDRIGSQAYNQKLSERRANAVRDYLVSKGVAKDKIETLGMGKTQPIPAVKCEMKAMKELIACLAPNRRVEVEVKGEAIKR